LSLDGLGNGMEDVSLVFSHGGKVAADPRKSSGPLHGSEAPRDFLLALDHPDVLFRLIVGEGDTEVGEEGENARMMLIQSLQEILSLGFFEPASPSRANRRVRVFPITFFQKFPISPEPRLEFLGGAIRPRRAVDSQRIQAFSVKVPSSCPPISDGAPRRERPTPGDDGHCTGHERRHRSDTVSKNRA